MIEYPSMNINNNKFVYPKWGWNLSLSYPNCWIYVNHLWHWVILHSSTPLFAYPFVCLRFLGVLIWSYCPRTVSAVSCAAARGAVFRIHEAPLSEPGWFRCSTTHFGILVSIHFSVRMSDLWLCLRSFLARSVALNWQSNWQSRLQAASAGLLWSSDLQAPKSYKL